MSLTRRGEYIPFTKFLVELSVQHKLICPHTHHQNGVVERKHKHVVEIALTMLSQAFMSLEYWDHVVTSVVYLINCLPSSSDQEVPYQKLFNRILNYKFLKVFGCACYPLLRPYNQNKLQPRSQECFFLGYSLSLSQG